MGHKSRWTLPTVVHPTTYRRFTICVPNERFYIAAFQGLLVELTYSKNWQRDPARTAAIVSRVWQHALEDVLCDDCGETILLEELEYQMSVCEQLRFLNGKLQGFCCGEWVDIAGQSANPPGGGDQPGGGTDQPPIGGCAQYHANMGADGQWYLPTIVSTGDTIEVSNALGAGNDGTVSPWHCPDGSSFFAGACIGGTGGPFGGDPAVAADHMELVANIDGTWYRPLAGVITVPGGVVNAQVYFQVNDIDVTDNAGSYTFDVEVCNNQPEEWTSLLDFRLNSFAAIRTGGYGVWVAGTGLQGESVLPFSGASVVQPHLATDAFELLGYNMVYSVATPGGGSEGVGLYQVGAASSYVKALVAPTAGSDEVDAGTGDFLSVTEIEPTLNSGLTGGTAYIHQVTIQGRGPKPAQLP